MVRFFSWRFVNLEEYFRIRPPRKFSQKSRVESVTNLQAGRIGPHFISGYNNHILLVSVPNSSGQTGWDPFQITSFTWLKKMWGFFNHLRYNGTRPGILSSPRRCFFRPRRPSRWRLENPIPNEDVRDILLTFITGYKWIDMYVYSNIYIYIQYTYSFTYPLLDIVSSG